MAVITFKELIEKNVSVKDDSLNILKEDGCIILEHAGGLTLAVVSEGTAYSHTIHNDGEDHIVVKNHKIYFS